MESADQVRAFCTSPAGSAFLLVVEENDLAPEVAADAAIAVHIAAIAINQIDIRNADHEAVVATALEFGAQRASLARAILEQPAAEQWFAPVGRSVQWCILRQGAEVRSEDLRMPSLTAYVMGALRAETRRSSLLLHGGRRYLFHSGGDGAFCRGFLSDSPNWADPGTGSEQSARLRSKWTAGLAGSRRAMPGNR